MAQMYFYKFNINAKIYDVYAKPELQDDILGNVYREIDSNLKAFWEYNNADGGKNIVEYKFCDIDKDPDQFIITGRLVKIYDGESQSYDRKNDTVKTKYEEDRAESATFCFDLLHEEIAFITRVGFRYLQFGEIFKLLLEKKFPEDSFELILEKNVGELKSKVYDLSRIIKVNSVMVAPNANESEFSELLGTTVEEFKETKATKYQQGIEISARGKNTINVKTKFFDRLFYAAGKGYATILVEGRDAENQKVSVDSDTDTPYKEPIPDREKDSIIAFKERAQKGITKLLRDKQSMRLESGDGKDGEKPKEIK